MITQITEFDIRFCRENILMLTDCNEECEIYDEVVAEYEEMLPKAYQKIKPLALMAFGDSKEVEITIEEGVSHTILYTLISIGSGLSEWSTTLFAEGNFLAGMLADAMADDYLFQMRNGLRKPILSLCKELGLVVLKEMHIPDDIPMSAQRKIWQVTNAEQLGGVKILDSFMYNPVKTWGQMYLLKENIQHDCSGCLNKDCKLREENEIAITVKNEEKTTVITGEKGKSLLQMLQGSDFQLVTPCGGTGICGKCKVRVWEGSLSISKEDQRYFSEAELNQGYRLACLAYPEESCVISLETNQEEEFQVVTEATDEEAYQVVIETTDEEAYQVVMESTDGKALQVVMGTTDENRFVFDEANLYGVAVDIGTTTLAMQLVELRSGKVVDVYTAVNRQRRFGADVISRIDASNKGEGETLQKLVREDLQFGLEALIRDKNVVLKKMIIGANATMVHLLLGYSCETLGAYPFTPVNIAMVYTTYESLINHALPKGTSQMQGLKSNILTTLMKPRGALQTQGITNETVCSNGDAALTVQIYPGISTYVGGDITAGLYALDFDRRKEIALLVDLGTNGEIAIGNKDKIMVTSTAIGPAFEGGNISCGVGSVPGAICQVELSENGLKVAKEVHKVVHLETIQDGSPIGLCGTGIIDAVYELSKAEYIDETGMFIDEYFEIGFLLANAQDGRELRLTQKDIREIQLAKSAVRAGVETLLRKYGVGYEAVNQIFIGGGFGYKMNVEKAIGIGLLPKEWRGKIEAVGNCCLQGARKGLCDADVTKRTETIVAKSTEVYLANDRDFNELYMDYMYFS